MYSKLNTKLITRNLADDVFKSNLVFKKGSFFSKRLKSMPLIGRLATHFKKEKVVSKFLLREYVSVCALILRKTFFHSLKLSFYHIGGAEVPTTSDHFQFFPIFSETKRNTNFEVW